MCMTDLTHLSLEDLTQIPVTGLQKIQANIHKAIEIRAKADKQSLLKTFHSMSAESGFTLSEVLDEELKQSVSPKKPAEPKYRNPGNPKQTWSGNGRKPGWLVQLISEGRALSEFEIN